MTIHAEQSDHDALSEAIDAASNDYVSMSGRSEIVEYYQETHGTNWKSHIVSDIVALTGKNKNTVGREFQMDKRLGTERYKSTKITKNTREKYEQLGKQLPPKKVPRNLKGKRAKVTIGATLWISKKAYFKSFTKELSESQTSRMLEGSFDPIIEAYQINPANVEEIQVDSISISFD